MGTRNVVLTDTQSALVDQLVASGRYQNASEALRAGLRLLEREEAELGDLRARLTSGLEEARQGGRLCPARKDRGHCCGGSFIRRRYLHDPVYGCGGQ